jgi:hypothetical protein
MKKNYLIWFPFVLGAFWAVGCQEQVNQPADSTTATGRMRFIQAASNADELDFAYQDLSDYNFYLAEENVSYGYQYGYYALITGIRIFRLYETNGNVVVSEGSVNIENAKIYTMMAFDYKDSISTSMIAYEDTLASPDSGEAFVRFINSCADLTDIRISDNENNNTLAVLSWLETSGYRNLAAGTYRFNVFGSTEQDTLLKTRAVTFDSGSVYTMILSGTITDLTPIPFNSKVFKDTSL